MQQLRKETVSRASPGHCARELLHSIPLVMRFIRAQLRGYRGAQLTVPQFRALVFVNCNDNASLSALAEQIGLSRPAASRMVDLLVKRGLVARQTASKDRRRVSLSLTGRGRAAFRAGHKAAQAALARRFAALSARELSQVSRTLTILSALFEPQNCRTRLIE